MASTSKSSKPISSYWKDKYSNKGKSQPAGGSGTRILKKKSGAKRIKSGHKIQNKANRKIKKRTIKLSPKYIFLIVLAIVIFLAIPFFAENESESGARVPEGSYRYGIDISHHNSGEPEWDSLRVMIGADGKTVRSMKAAKSILPVTFVFIKATEGLDFKDRNFKRNWVEAGKRNYARGAYHFYRSSKDPVIQAQNFIKTVGELRYRDLSPVLDVETIHRGCSRKSLNDNLLLWLKIVGEKYGRKPVIYTS